MRKSEERYRTPKIPHKQHTHYGTHKRRKERRPKSTKKIMAENIPNLGKINGH